MSVKDIVEKYPNIYNVENKTLFLEQTYGHLSDFKIIEYARILSKIGKVESFSEKDLNQFSLTEFIFLFERLGWVSFGTFSVRKVFVESYLSWSVQNSLVEYKNLENLKLMNCTDLSGTIVFERSHFKNFEEIHSTNTAIISNELSKHYKEFEESYSSQNALVKNEYAFQCITNENNFIMQEILTYLAWMRLSLEEMINLKTDDINVNSKQMRLGSRLIEIPDDILEKIKICMNTKENVYILYGKVVKRDLINSIYLLRSTKLSKYTTNAIQQILTKYSEASSNLSVLSKFYNKNLKYNDIYRSSLCAAFYDYEQITKIQLDKLPFRDKIKLLSTEFKNEKIARTNIKDYFKWREYYYNV